MLVTAPFMLMHKYAFEPLERLTELEDDDDSELSTFAWHPSGYSLYEKATTDDAPRSCGLRRRGSHHP